MVTSLGGAVVGLKGEPTLAILQNDHRAGCQGTLTHLVPRCRIVRERWLLRLEGLAPGEPLPDCKPDAVYAEVREILDPRSYFYDALAPPRRTSEKLRVIREDWTPPAQADDGA